MWEDDCMPQAKREAPRMKSLRRWQPRAQPNYSQALAPRGKRPIPETAHPRSPRGAFILHPSSFILHPFLKHLRQLKLRDQCVVPFMMVMVALKAERARRFDVGKQIVDEKRAGRFQAELPANHPVNLATRF